RDTNARLGPSLKNYEQGLVPTRYLYNEFTWASMDKKSSVAQVTVYIPYTFLSNKSSTSIDYICTSSSLVHLFSDVRFIFREESDHFPIMTSSRSPSEVRPYLKEATNILANVQVYNYKRIYWHRLDVESVTNYLGSEEARQLAEKSPK
ncbi:hypothetical protein E2320_022640, partial [Naja naja]